MIPLERYRPELTTEELATSGDVVVELVSEGEPEPEAHEWSEPGGEVAEITPGYEAATSALPDGPPDLSEFEADLLPPLDEVPFELYLASTLPADTGLAPATGAANAAGHIEARLSARRAA